MRFKNYLPLLVIAGCLCPSLFWAQSYRVKAPHVDKVSISEETNPPARTYAIIDLGTDLEPVRVTNSGYVLCTDGAVTKRWYQGELEDLTGGDDEETVAGYDINEQGTVVGDVHLDSARYPAPACGYAGQYTPWFAEYNYGTGGAVRWDAGQTEASLLGGAFASGFTIQTGPDVPPYTGAVSGSSAMTIDDSGHIYGSSLLAYQELPAYSEQDGTFHVTHWGSYSSGYDFTGGTGLGTQSLAQDADGFHVMGKVYQIDKARGGATFGSGDGNYYMNDQLVDFRPLNLNSHGLALGSIRDPGYNDFQPYERYYIIGPGPGTRTDLKVSRPRFLGSADYPAALNHRTISVTDSEGQVTTKVSPQVVGSRGTFWGSDGAAIWEEDPKSGQYQMQYLNQLVPPDSGWNLQYANDINDDGLIAAEGWYQPKDQDGNPAGELQWRACLLLPVEFVEVKPLLKDEAGTDIPNSEKPKFRPAVNDMVEEPIANQIPNVAYRTLKVRVPATMEGETMKWTMTPLFTPEGEAQPRLRGQWPQAHPDRFEADSADNYYIFERVSQVEGRTTIDNSGETAVRVNLPPIGFNKARVKVEFERYSGVSVEIDFEVPAVVVIDPGHGGTGRITDPDGGFSDGEHAVGPVSHIQEKTMALSYGLQLRDRLKSIALDQHFNIKVLMTRETDVNLGPRARTNRARDNGADVLLSIHLNGSDTHTARGTETWIRRPAENRNYDEDFAFAQRIQAAIFGAIHNFDAGAIDRGIKEGGLVMTSDDQLHLGNTDEFHPIRAALVEVEFLDNSVVDRFLNMGNSQPIQTNVVERLATAIIQDIKQQPAQ